MKSCSLHCFTLTLEEVLYSEKVSVKVAEWTGGGNRL